jgi:hypothetical protein
LPPHADAPLTQPEGDASDREVLLGVLTTDVVGCRYYDGARSWPPLGL